MPLQHYLPASYIGNFSLDTKNKSSRDRVLFAYNFSTGNLFKTRAKNLCSVNNYYPEMVDAVWRYESNLPNALLGLIDNRVDAKVWIRTLVPFVASLLLRAPEFEWRFKKRIKDLAPENNTDTNGARLFELQRILAPILAADWIVLEIKGAGSVILNDVGFTPFVDGPTSKCGYAIPLDIKHILILVPNRKRAVAKLINNTWYPMIKYANLLTGHHFSFNRQLAVFALNFIIGPSENSIKPYINASRPSEPIKFEEFHTDFISGSLMAVHEFTWHRLASLLERDPRGVSDGTVEIEYDNLVKGWCPPIILPINLPEFPSSVDVVGEEIIVNLYDYDIDS